MKSSCESRCGSQAHRSLAIRVTVLLALCACHGPADTSGGTTPEDSRDTVPVRDSLVETELPQESEAPPETGQLETGVEIDTGDSGDPPLAGESFECGEWTTKAAPSGLTKLREADLIIDYDQHDREIGYHSINGAFATDTDGDGCSEIVLSATYYEWENYRHLVFVPGTLSDAVYMEERSSAVVKGEDGHYLQEVGFGDLDGDGQRDDWALGAKGASFSPDGFSGAVYLFHDEIAGVQDESYADATIWPPDDASTFCWTLEVGQYNDNEVNDIAIGGGFGRDGDGRVVIIEGGFGEDTTVDASVFSVDGPRGSAAFGAYLTLESALDGDGFFDLVPTAYSQDGYRGEFYVFYGPHSGAWTSEDADRTILGESTLMLTGHGIAGGADANVDGYDDLLVAASGTSYGAVYLVLGPVARDGTLADAGAVFYGGESLGQEAVSLDQDIDSDGFPDPAMGNFASRAYSSDTTGAAFLFYGPVSGTYAADDADAIFYEQDPETALGFVGATVTTLGDTDGDGFDDLLLGQYGVGPAYVFRGGPR